jgi:hypothetical protein
VLGVGLSAVVGATELPPPELSEPYTATPCGQPGQVTCNITPTGRTPTAADLQGLSSELFYNYFVSQGNSLVCSNDFSWTPLAANANGYVIGSLTEGCDILHTQFIYHAGQILFSGADEPFRLYDINDQNVIVGSILGAPGPDGGFGLVDDPPFIAVGTPSGLMRVALAYIDPAFATALHGPWASFTAIDNHDNILLNGPYQQQFMLQPTPEPASIVFLATVLLGCSILTRRRLKHRAVPR